MLLSLYRYAVYIFKKKVFFTNCDISDIALQSVYCSGAESQIAYWLMYHKFKQWCISGHCVGFQSGEGWGSLICRAEVSFKSGKPYSTFLLPEDGTLVCMLVSYDQSQTSMALSDVYYFRVCIQWQFHDIKLMEWVNHLGLPLIPIRQSSQVRKVTQLAS